MSYDTNYFIDVTTRGSSDYVINVNGAIHAQNAARLRDALLDALSASPTRLTVNLAAVTSVDPSGLDELVGAHRRATAAGTRMLCSRVTDAELAHLLQQNGLSTTAGPAPDQAATTDSVRPRRPFLPR